MSAARHRRHGTFSAWQLDTAAILERRGLDPATSGTVDQWLVQAPWAHPLWHTYWLHIAHLRPILRDGAEIPTILHLEGATHELWLYAVHPDTQIEQLLVTGDIPFLTPMNFASQLILRGDDAARYLLGWTVEDVLHGRLNPDTDARRQWAERFGGNMCKGELSSLSGTYRRRLIEAVQS